MTNIIFIYRTMYEEANLKKKLKSDFIGRKGSFE